MSENCFYCEKPAKYFCDFILEAHGVLKEPLKEPCSKCGCGGATTDELLAAMMHAEPFVTTCDRPLCEDHRHFVNAVFFDGDAKHTFVDSRDMCPGHKDIAGGFKPDDEPPDNSGPGRPMRMAA